MPWAAAATSDLLIPVRTSSELATGEVAWTWDYSGVEAIPCRFYDKSAISQQYAFGQAMQVDAVAQVDAREMIEPLVLSDDTGERRQCKVDGILYEIVKVVDLGNIGVRKQLELKKWK